MADLYGRNYSHSDRHGESSASAAAPEVPRKMRRRVKSINNVRSKPAKEEVLSSMIDSLGDLTPRGPVDPRAYIERTPSLTTPRSSSRPGSARSEAWTYGDGIGARPPANRQRTGELRSRSDSVSLRSVAEEEDSAAAPVIFTYKETPTLRSQRSSSLLRGQDSLRGVRKALSIRSNSRSASRQSARSDDTTSTVKNRTHPSPDMSGKSQPVLTGDRASTSSNSDHTSQSSRPTTGTTTDESRKDSHAETRKDRRGQAGFLEASSRETSRESQMSGPDRSNDSMTESTRKSEKSPAHFGGGSADTSNPITAAIPQRVSSLSHVEKRTMDHKRRSKRHSSGTTKTRRNKKKSAILEEDVLTELGEEDDTVRRIKQLRQLMKARAELLNRDETGSEVGDGDSQGIVSLRNAERGVKRDRVGRAQRSRKNSPGATTATIPSPHDSEPSKPPHSPPPPPPPPSSQLPRPLSSHPPNIRPPPSSSTSQHSNKSPTIAGTRSPLGPASPPTDDVSVTNHDRSPSALSGDATMIGLLRQDLTPLGVSTSKRQTIFFSTDNEPPKERRLSVDQDVNGFISDPRLSQTVRHPKTGRVISFSEVGDPKGHPVFVCVGMGLTRFVSAFYDDLAATLQLRLITPDRPGVGNSAQYGERDAPGPMSWHQDVTTICNHLNISNFSLLAHSAGAVFALATALVLPQHVVGKIYLLAPWIPPSQYEVPSSGDASNTSDGQRPNTSLPTSQRFLRILPASFLRAVNGSWLGINTNSLSSAPNKNNDLDSRSKRRSTSPRPSSRADISSLTTDLTRSETADPSFPLPSDLLTTSNLPSTLPALSATTSPTDSDLLYASAHLHAAQHSAHQHAAALSTALVHAIWAASTRNSNPATDLLVCLERSRAIGFRYVDVRSPMVVLHGAGDKRVAARNVSWLVGRINAVRAARRANREAEREELRKVRRERREAERAARGKGSPTLDPRNMWKGGSGHAVSLNQEGTVEQPDRESESSSSEEEEDDGEDEEVELRVLDGQGHGLMASAAVMGDVLSEIAIEVERRKLMARQ